MYTKLDNVAYEFWIATVILDIIQFSALARNSDAWEEHNKWKIYILSL